MTELRYHLLGRSGLRVSELGLGTMTFGTDGVGRGPRREPPDLRALRRGGRELRRHGHPLSFLGVIRSMAET